MATQRQFKVTGMTCGGCENAVTRSLKMLEGVKAVTASHSTESVDVTFEDDKVTPAAITERIESLGYHVEH
jgi:copper chaperone CopZ